MLMLLMTNCDIMTLLSFVSTIRSSDVLICKMRHFGELEQFWPDEVWLACMKAAVAHTVFIVKGYQWLFSSQLIFTKQVSVQP